jgi:molybdate transport system substrate-binding protein
MVRIGKGRMMNYTGRVSAAILVTFLCIIFVPAVRADAPVTVFAAASLSDALQTVGKAYEGKTHEHVVFSFAASSALARQIEASSGADIFISADTDWMDELEKKGLTEAGSRRNLFGNHLALIAPAQSTVLLRIAPGFDIIGALRGGRLAVADPESVPAGKYARASLIALHAWDYVKDRLAPAENVRAALAYVARGEAPLGIVYTTDALSEPRVRIIGTFPDATHPPIVYPAALLKGAKQAAPRFLAFLSGPQAKSIFQAAGFVWLDRR